MIWFIKVASAVIWYSGFCYDVVWGGLLVGVV